MSQIAAPESFPAPFITIVISFFKEYKASLSSLLSLLNLSLGISISRSFSSKELRYVSITTSLFFELNVEFGLNFILQSNIISSFLKCHINLSFLPNTSNSCLSLALSILSGVGTNLSSFERSEISDFACCLCDKLITFLLTNFPFSLLFFNLALLSSISCATSELLLSYSDSPLQIDTCEANTNHVNEKAHLEFLMIVGSIQKTFQPF